MTTSRLWSGQQPNIDGFLVGGASLKGGAFTTIINSVWATMEAQPKKKPQALAEAMAP